MEPVRSESLPEMKKAEEFEANNKDGMEMGIYICDEIEEEILLRLPAKYVLQFKYVSKTWYNRITNSEFAQKHLKLQRQTQSNNFNLMLHGSGGPLQSVSCSSIDKDAKTIPHNQPLLPDFIKHEKHIFNVVGSCDGLLLVLATSTDYIGGFVDFSKCVDYVVKCFDYVIYIWNPATGEYKTLPQLLPYIPDSIVFGFGPDLSTTDDNNNHYKVLLFETVHGLFLKDETIHNYNMYTTRTNSWKPLLQNIGPCGYFTSIHKGMILASNNLHFVAEIDTTEDDPPFLECIVSFNLKDDKFRQLPLVDPTSTSVNICALNGDLCVFSSSRIGNDISYDLWRMENFGVKNEECWTKICSIDYFQEMDNKPIFFISPLHVLEDGQILLYAKPSCPHRGKPFIISYHIENKKASFLVQCNVPYWSIPVVYEESLISPDAASTVEE